MLSDDDKRWFAEQIGEQIAAQSAGLGAVVLRSEKNLMDVVESLRRDMESMHSEMQSMHSEMQSGFQRVEGRLGLHGGLIQGGARQITRLIEWSEQVNRMMADRDKTIEELKRRLDKLEGAA